jgi:hypothetical protein
MFGFHIFEAQYRRPSRMDDRLPVCINGRLPHRISIFSSNGAQEPKTIAQCAFQSRNKDDIG